MRFAATPRRLRDARDSVSRPINTQSPSHLKSADGALTHSLARLTGDRLLLWTA